jgi:FAD-dependent oxidoreductase domain-containing protein 1
MRPPPSTGLRSSASRFRPMAFSSKSNVCNTLIVGGGPIGSSTAYHLAISRGGDGKGIVVVEKDPTYARASATLSAGGIRQQYSLKENVQMSLYGRDFLRNSKELLRVSKGDDFDVQFKEHGYLFLATTGSGREQMMKSHKVQCEAGCTDIKLLDRHELKETFPWINSEDILLASYGLKGEGWFDPWGYINGLRTKSIEMGVQYLHGIPRGAKRDETSGKVVSIDIEPLAKTMSPGDVVTYNVDNVVNAAGARSEDVMTMLAGTDRPLRYPLPVKARKRSIFFFHCAAREAIPPIAPLTVDPSLVYFRSEGSGENSNFICGVSPHSEMDPDIYDEGALDSADYSLFEEIIWPALYHRVPAFGEIKVKSSWSGLYEYNVIDQNAIIDFHPEIHNVLVSSLQSYACTNIPSFLIPVLFSLLSLLKSIHFDAL